MPKIKIKLTKSQKELLYQYGMISYLRGERTYFLSAWIIEKGDEYFITYNYEDIDNFTKGAMKEWLTNLFRKIWFKT